MSVTIEGAITTTDFGHGTINVDGVKYVGQIWPLRNFLRLFLSDPIERPETQEDWKAIAWNFGSPKPSHIEQISVAPTDDKTMMVVYWKEKDNGLHKV